VSVSLTYFFAAAFTICMILSMVRWSSKCKNKAKLMPRSSDSMRENISSTAARWSDCVYLHSKMFTSSPVSLRTYVVEVFGPPLM
jgi:hypothetical protein